MIRNNSSECGSLLLGGPRQRYGWLGFALLFFIGFAALQAGYSYFLADPLKVAVLQLSTLDPSAGLINLFTPREQVLVKKQLLLSPYAILAVQKGCEGTEGLFLLFAAVAAFRASWRQKILGWVAGLGLIAFLNISRIVSLYYVLRFEKKAFGLLHGYLWPSGIVLAGALFFLWWTEQQEGMA